MFLNRIKDISKSYIDDATSFAVTIPGDFSINKKFQTIRNAFEIITSEQTTLSSHEDNEFDKNSLINELKFDFKRNRNRTTYKNIVAYLYGNKHEVNTLKDFDKNQYDVQFEKLISLLNDDKLFNSNLFSNHSKLRFMERYVLTEDSAYTNLARTTKRQVRYFIEALKRELGKGVNITPYYADGTPDKVGIQVRFNDPKFGVVKITLNNEEKMHTII